MFAQNSSVLLRAAAHPPQTCLPTNKYNSNNDNINSNNNKNGT